MKIFQTQLQGLLGRLSEYEFELEDVARIISQTMISDGQLYIYGEREMVGVVYQAISGEDSLPGVVEASGETVFSELDTLLVFVADASSDTAVRVVKKAVDGGAQIVGVSSKIVGRAGGDDDQAVMDANSGGKENWTSLCQFHFSTGISKGLVPTEDGGRIGAPHLVVALHLYYSLYFIIMEFLEENEV